MEVIWSQWGTTTAGVSDSAYILKRANSYSESQEKQMMIADLLNRGGPLWLAYLDMEGVYLGYADLTGAILCKANFTNANLKFAKLENAKLLEAVLDNVNLEILT